MNDNHLYLDALKIQLGTVLWPSEKDEFSQKMGFICLKILARLITHLKKDPELHQMALKSYAELLSGMAAALGANDDLVRQMERHIRITPNYEEAIRVLQAAVPRLLSRKHDVAACKILERFALIDQELLAELGKTTAVEEVKPEAEKTEGDYLSAKQIQQFEVFLHEKYPAESALAVGGVKVIAGGFSKQTFVVELKNGIELPSTVVIRADKSFNVLGTDIGVEYGIIKTAYDEGVPVPKPWQIVLDTSVLGNPFALFGFIEGKNIGDPFDVYEKSRDFVVSLARALVHLHRIPPEKFGTKIHGANVSTKERMLEDITAAENNWRSYGDASIQMEMAFDWLKDNIHLADGCRSMIHRDIGCHNLLVKDNVLTGILDWENAAIGDPVQDLGYVYPMVIQVMPWEDFIAEYVAAGGSKPGQQQLDFYRIWREVWLTMNLLQAKAGMRSGLMRDIRLIFALFVLIERVTVPLQEILCKVFETRNS